jgi:enamine deaminase RidA (YjgF/YER057c/UK114 family)
MQQLPSQNTVNGSPSQITFVGSLAFVYGLIGADLNNPKIALDESVEAQTQKIMVNLDTVLSAYNLKRFDVVAVHVWLRDFHRFRERFEVVWTECFSEGHSPTRQLLGVSGLMRDALVSMDFVINRHSH